MAELRIACPSCGMPLTAPTENELAKVWQEHSKAVHSMEPSEAEAKEKVKQLLEAQSGE